MLVEIRFELVEQEKGRRDRGQKSKGSPVIMGERDDGG
jgi:hypothetical protein